MRITTVDPIKWAALLNILPLSFGSKMGRSLNIQALMPTCTTRKLIRNNPESAITSFLPTEEVKNSDHFISKILRSYLSISRQNAVSRCKGSTRSSKTGKELIIIYKTDSKIDRKGD